MTAETTRYQIAPMDLAESAKYLQHHLALAGRTDPLIADHVVARLHKALGLPRALNNAAIAAIAAATAGKALVDDHCARRAVAELYPRLNSAPTADSATITTRTISTIVLVVGFSPRSCAGSTSNIVGDGDRQAAIMIVIVTLANTCSANCS